MAETSSLKLDGQSIDLPVVVGSENEKAIDIAQLRAKTGYVTIDPAYMNTASTESGITFLDGDKGILRYRGIPIEQLAEKASFVEVMHLLIYGKLPNKGELDNFTTLLTRHTMIHEDMKHLFDGFPHTAHPMAILSAMVLSLSSYYPEPDNTDSPEMDTMIARLLAKLPTLAAYSYKKSIGQPFIYPNNSLNYCANFLSMMFSVPAERYDPDEELTKTLNLLLVLHADHEQNCSTSTVRLVGSSQANLFASIASGICALWGPLHGGANQEVVQMLEQIQASGMQPKEFIEKVKDKSSQIKLMGFGHRVYKNYDPRAKIIKAATDRLLQKLGRHDPLLDIARALEDAALKDQYFVDRKLYPNVDFYSGIVYRAVGIPTNMFTVMFALGRLPGWIAHWREMRMDKNSKIGRPRQIYTGPKQNDYQPVDKR